VAPADGEAELHRRNSKANKHPFSLFVLERTEALARLSCTLNMRKRGGNAPSTTCLNEARTRQRSALLATSSAEVRAAAARPAGGTASTSRGLPASSRLPARPVPCVCAVGCAAGVGVASAHLRPSRCRLARAGGRGGEKEGLPRLTSRVSTRSTATARATATARQRVCAARTHKSQRRATRR
jgi:hypothetical protein